MHRALLARKKEAEAARLMVGSASCRPMARLEDPTKRQEPLSKEDEGRMTGDISGYSGLWSSCMS